MTSAVIGLIGTALGAVIATATQIIIARQHCDNSLKLAALDKRLEVHQKAYSLCVLMRSNINSDVPEKNKIRQECADWWNENCLYLAKDSREEFDNLILDFSYYDKEEEYKDIKKYAYKQFIRNSQITLRAIAKDVALPSLTKREDDFE